MFEKLMPVAIQSGINIFDYWELTYGEIVLHIECFNNNEINDMKSQAMMTYQLSNLIGVSIARLFDKNTKFPSIGEVFPTLFEEVVLEQKQDWRIVKENFMAYAEANNKKERGQINDT